MQLLVVMDPPACIDPASDTTITFIGEARERGHRVLTCTPADLSIVDGDVWARAHLVNHVDRAQRPALDISAGGALALGDCQAVLMRKDPPFDIDYYFATQILDRAKTRTLVVNDPRGLREANEKLYIFHFPRWIVPTIVTRSQEDLLAFLDGQGGEMILKPLDGAGGAGVFHVQKQDRNTRSLLELSTAGGRRWVMAQKYLPAARQGDKRILLLDGEPLGAVLRVPRADDTRGNLHVGGQAHKTTLSDKERELCVEVGARCRQDGLFFVGLDVIGGHLTEVNVTSPTGVQEIDRLDGARLEARFIDWLEERVRQ